jgi:hypothetical protein
MRLTLTYEGPLHAASNANPRNPEKHAIRKQFHEQLQDVWVTHPALEGWLEKWQKLEPSKQVEFDSGSLFKVSTLVLIVVSLL